MDQETKKRVRKGIADDMRSLLSRASESFNIEDKAKNQVCLATLDFFWDQCIRKDSPAYHSVLKLKEYIQIPEAEAIGAKKMMSEAIGIAQYYSDVETLAAIGNISPLCYIFSLNGLSMDKFALELSTAIYTASNRDLHECIISVCGYMMALLHKN